jgi:drug/metabolite transporter (DMT)-like permease
MPPAINRTMSPATWALLLVLALLWGGSYFYNAIAIASLPPLTIVAARTLIGSLALYAAVRLSGARMPVDMATWLSFLGMGLLNNVLPFSLIAWSQTSIPSGLASVLNATTPLFGVILAHFATADEKLTPLRIAGVAIGFLGVVVMLGADSMSGERHLVAELACLFASVLYAYSGVFGRRFAARGIPPLVTATGQITASMLVMVPVAALYDQPWQLAMPSASAIAALLGLGLVSTALAYVIYYRILAAAGAVNLLLVTFLVPVSAILLGAVILGERLGFNHFVGIAGIGLGLAAIDGRPIRRLARLAG